MSLREELKNIDADQVILALSEQIVSDPPEGAHKLMERAKWYSE